MSSSPAVYFVATRVMFPILPKMVKFSAIGSLLLAPIISQAELVNTALTTSKYPLETASIKPKVLLATTFLQCSPISNDVARLACFDTVAKKGNADVLIPKQPLDIAKTVEATIQERKAIAVLADGTIPTTDRPVLLVQDNQDNQDKPSKLSKLRKFLVIRRTSDTDNNNTATNNNTAIIANNSITSKANNKTAGFQPKIDSQDDKILQKVGVNKEALQQYSPLSGLFDLNRDDPAGILTIRPHQPMYVMPVWYSATPNRHPFSPTRAQFNYEDTQIQPLESKMQLSLKTKVLQNVGSTNADVWLGYTQQSYWQVYNGRQSRPFLSTDYQPEIFITQPVQANLPWGGRLRVLGAGAVHQSNGQSDPLSRSWNRAYLMGGAEWGNLTVLSRLWYIMPENHRTSDNPDISDYMGYGDVRFLYNLGSKNTFGGMIRYNPATSKGALQLDYAHPLAGGLKGYIQLFHGYGENIQNYNHIDTNIGVGVMFNDFLGL